MTVSFGPSLIVGEGDDETRPSAAGGGAPLEQEREARA